MRLLPRVETEKVAVRDPAATVTLAGTLARDGRLLYKATSAPPAGAFAERVTVPVDVAPPVTVVGFKVSACSVTAGAGLTVRVADFVTPA